MVILLNGEPVTSTEVEVDAASPMWLSGQSLFETMRIRREGVTGIFGLEAHLERLVASAERLGWTGCPLLRRLHRWVGRASLIFRRSTREEGRLRLTVAWTRREGPPVTVVTVTPYKPPEKPAAVISTAMAIPWTGDPAAKVGSRFLYDAAWAKAARAGADEAILVDREGRPVEGSRSNVFVALNDCIATPPLDLGPLAGVARRTVLELAIEAGCRVEERPLAWEELHEGAPFLSNALWGVRLVRTLDGRPCGGPVEVVRHLRALYERQVKRTLERQKALVAADETTCYNQ